MSSKRWSTSVLVGLLCVVIVLLALFTPLAHAAPVGAPYAWGSNQSRQLGDGTTSERLTPVTVTGLSGVGRLRQALITVWLSSGKQPPVTSTAMASPTSSGRTGRTAT